MDKFETLLQNHPITVPTRKELSQDTMTTIIQVKGTRLAQKMLVGLLVLTTLLFILKWLNNDLLYLIQLIFFKFTFIKDHLFLYWEAVKESFPKQQLIIMFFAVLLWVGWRRFETFLLHSRITTRQTFIMKMIRLTPRLLFINSLIMILGIGFVTYSYAQRTEQKQLQLLKEYVNKSGRVAFETNFPANQCDTTGNTNLTNQFEIKKNTQLNPQDAKNVLEATCNEAEAKKFLITAFHLGDPNQGIEGIEKSPTSDIEVFITSQVIKKEDDTLILQDSGPSDPSQTFSFTPQTKVYKNNVQVSQNTLQKDDIVVPLVKNHYNSTTFGHPSGDVTNRTLLGVYILPAKLEFKWYGLNFQHMITQIEMCPGNSQDHCTFTGGVDFFPISDNEGNTTNPEFTQAPQGIQKEIAGKLLDIHSQFVKIKTSSGRIFTIQFGHDVVNEFNQKKTPYYKATIGDTLLITYFEPADQHATTLDTNQIVSVVLMLEIVNKAAPNSKY